jgi:hypothetical protein
MLTKYLGWILALLLAICFIINQNTIYIQKETIKNYTEAIKIWEDMFYDCKGWK